MSGLIMRPLLLCSKCPHSVEVQFARGIPDVGGTLTCTKCGSRLLLVSYGVVDDEPSPRSLLDSSLNRARGTWWR